MHAAVEPLDQLVDVGAAPVGTGQRAAVCAVALPARLVGKVQLAAVGLDRVRIEIVVDVDGVDVVAAQHVDHDREHVLGGGRLAGVDPVQVAIAPHQFWPREREVRRRIGRRGRRRARAIRVEPGVQFEPARMGLGDPARQRVPAGIGALGASQVLGPRFQRRGVDRVGARPHLQDHGVEADGLRLVEQRDHFGLLLGRRQTLATRPVDVGHRRDPGGTKLARRGRRRRVDRVDHAAHRRIAAGGQRQRQRQRQRESQREHQTLTNHRLRHIAHAITNMPATNSSACSSEAFTGASGSASSGA